MTGPRTRLFCDQRLAPEAIVALSDSQGHRLKHVLRLGTGNDITLFNDRDGEWRALIAGGLRQPDAARVLERLRPPAPEPDRWLLAAPVKRAALDLMVEKATELGVSRVVPVMTRRTNTERVRTDRLRAIATEAAEQCGRLGRPEIAEPAALDHVLASWPAERTLLFCDEAGAAPPLLTVLAGLAPAAPLALLIGPEGGFAAEERAAIRTLPLARPASLGPRILRAETAAIAALALIQGQGDAEGRG